LRTSWLIVGMFLFTWLVEYEVTLPPDT